MKLASGTAAAAMVLLALSWSPELAAGAAVNARSALPAEPALAAAGPAGTLYALTYGGRIESHDRLEVTAVDMRTGKVSTIGFTVYLGFRV